MFPLEDIERRLPEEKVISIGGLELHYLDWGNTEFQSILLLRGLCGFAHYWDFLASRLSQDYHVLAIDQRGHGDSNWQPSYSLKDFVADLESFTTQLGLSDLILIGHSLGGIIAAIYASSHPDQISRLIIIDIGPEINVAGLERMEAVRQSEPETFASEDDASSYFQQIEPRQSKEFIQQLVCYALKRNQENYLTFKYDKALYDLALRYPRWLWDELEQIVCPTLVMVGRESDLLELKVA